jgi:hypothetical protein
MVEDVAKPVPPGDEMADELATKGKV